MLQTIHYFLSLLALLWILVHSLPIKWWEICFLILYVFGLLPNLKFLMCNILYSFFFENTMIKGKNKCLLLYTTSVWTITFAIVCNFLLYPCNLFEATATTFTASLWVSNISGSYDSKVHASLLQNYQMVLSQRFIPAKARFTSPSVSHILVQIVHKLVPKQYMAPRHKPKRPKQFSRKHARIQCLQRKRNHHA